MKLEFILVFIFLKEKRYLFIKQTLIKKLGRKCYVLPISKGFIVLLI